MPFRLPPRFHAPWRTLAQADEANLDRLVAALDKASPALLPAGLAASLNVAGFEQQDLLGVVELLTSLSAVKEQRRGTATEVLTDIRADVSRLGAEAPPRAGWPKLVAAVDAALNTKSVIITSKAVGVMVAHEHCYLNSRVLTDIRPLFGQATDHVEAGVIVHTLRLEYRQGERSDVFFLALDRDDVVALRDNLTRALEKSKTIKTQFAALQFLGEGDER